LIWVAGLADGAPVEGAQITLFDGSGRRAFNGVSDARGLLSLPSNDKLLAGPKSKSAELDEYEGGRERRVIALVEKGDDLAVVDAYWSDGLEAWNFNLSSDYAATELATRGFIETDRGIYRPGETVHVKGLVRDVPLAGDPRVPGKKQIEVHVEDGNGAALLDQTSALTEFGGFNVDVPLDPEARTGDYYITAKLGKASFRQSFSVEEIRPVSFEITADKLKENVTLGSASEVAIEARYLFGAPVSDAEVTYDVEKRRHWLYFSEFSDYSFDDWSELAWTPWWEPDRNTGFVSEGSGRTDAKGRFAFKFKDEAKDVDGPQDYVVRTSVRDAADQEVTKRLSITGHPSDFYLGVGLDSWVATAGKPFKVRVVAVGKDGKPVAAEAKLSVESVETRCDYDEGPYGYWHCDRRRTGLETRALKIEPSAPHTESITIKEAGSHLIVVETKDARGHRVKSSASIWLIGPGQSYWASDDSQRMGLIPSKRSYAPGDTAVLVPEAATDGGTMLVTVERNGILEARLERAQGTPGIEIPLSEAHAPNVFVSVALVRGRTGPKDSERPSLKLGMVSLPVTFAQRALNVQISTEGTDFEPGQTVRGKVRVLGKDGAPVRAEVALSAADEGVLQLIGYQTPNPMDSFYEPWGLGVRSAANWTRVAKLQDTPADVEDGEEGADGAGASGSDRVRSRFVASAFWAPALVTDAQGEASFSFEAPDNLTAFRLMAAVADTGARFGSAEQRVRVRKDLLLAPVVPRFLLADDKIELGAVVHNYTDQPVEVETRFDIEGAVPRKTSLRSKIASNGKAVLRVPVKVQTGTEAVFRAETALINAAPGQRAPRDALELKLPIQRAAVKEADTLFAGHAASDKGALEWHKGVDPQASLLEVSIDRTGVADLGPSLKYLVQYPYGCLEQTMSGLIPLLKVRDLAKSLDLKELKGPQLDRFIELGVAKVIRHQHGDGHFSLWPDSNTYPHLTVYALWGLNEARRGGVRVEKRALDLGLTAVRAWAHDAARAFSPSDETGTLAMAAFVMAELGEPDPALNARLFAAKSALPVYGKAYL
ncbi:MAG TPA: alpha-2-macroglobulin family protein, partial [Polyangiales bacterium]